MLDSLTKKRVLGFIFIALIFDRIASNLLVSETLITYAHVSHSVLFKSGFLLLIFPTYILLSPIIGNISDLIGRKQLLCACYIMGVVAFIFAITGIFTKNLAITLLAYLSIGISSVSIPLILGLICDYSNGACRMKCIGYYIAIVVLLSIINYLPRSSLKGYFSGDIALIFGFFSELVALFIAIRFIPKDLKDKFKQSPEFYHSHNFVNRCIRALMPKNVRLVLVSLFVFSFCWGLYRQIPVTMIMQIYHASILEPVIYSVYISVMMAFSLIILYPFAVNRSNPAILLLSVLSTSTLCFVALIITKYMFWHIIITLFVSVGSGFIFALYFYLLAYHSAQRFVGLIMGVSAACWSLGWAFSYMMALWLFRYVLSRNMYYIISIVSAILVLVLTTFTWKFYKKNRYQLNQRGGNFG